MKTLLEMWRSKDPTGNSGTGKVAEGMRFSDGSVVLRWLGAVKSTVHYNSLEDAKKIHGHDGLTRIFCVGDAFDRGGRDAYQDRCENIRDLLKHEADGKAQKPDWIVDSDWETYLLGYEHTFQKIWRTPAPWLRS